MTYLRGNPHRAGPTGHEPVKDTPGGRDLIDLPVVVPFRTQHPLGVVVNRPSVWPDR